MKRVFICSAKRTPQGSFGGVLSSVSATTLGSTAIIAALEAARIEASSVQEVFMGNVCSANLGQAPARQAALGSGISETVPATTINKVCASGMKAIMLGAQTIQLGINEVVVTGGMESMSNIPFYAPKTRWGAKFGDVKLIDGLAKDGLTDAYDQVAMGSFADAVSELEGISREDQDHYAIESYRRSRNAFVSGRFDAELAAVSVPQRRGDALVVREDEEYSKVNVEKIPLLRAAFSKGGTATAANASTINDGASAVVLCSEAFVEKHGITPLAELLDYSDAALAPKFFTIAPVKAAKKIMERQHLKFSAIDIFEINEAFSMVPIAFAKKCGLSTENINVNGGAVSLGHPIGSSGSRIVASLIHQLCQQDLDIGLAAICNGGGGASALLLKRL